MSANSRAVLKRSLPFVAAPLSPLCFLLRRDASFDSLSAHFTTRTVSSLSLIHHRSLKLLSSARVCIRRCLGDRLIAIHLQPDGHVVRRILHSERCRPAKCEALGWQLNNDRLWNSFDLFASLIFYRLFKQCLQAFLHLPKIWILCRFR